MKGHKIALVIGAVLVGLLCLVGAWITYQAFAQADDVKQSLDGFKNQFLAFYHKPVFPCPTNTLQATIDEKNIAAWSLDLYKDLVASQPAASSNTPSLFIQHLQKTVRDLHAVAAANSTKLAPESAADSFGFNQYLGATGVMPKPDDVPRLSLQLGMTETIMREIFACHIKSLTSVEREVFEMGLATASSGPKSHRPGMNMPVPVATPVVVPGNGLYSKQRFTITFSCSEQSLVNVLNNLAKMPMFVIINDLETTREGRGLLVSSEKNATAETTNRIERLDRAQRVASGPDVSSSLKTRLQVDVYTFNGV